MKALQNVKLFCFDHSQIVATKPFNIIVTSFALLNFLMQFCCNLKEEATYHHYVKSVLAVWLMMLFIGTSFFQIFHHHEHPAIDKQYHQTSVQKWVKSCEVCDYLAHHHAIPILTAHHFELTPPVKSNAAFAGRYYIGCYKFTLQGFTNKGPPSIIS